MRTVVQLVLSCYDKWIGDNISTTDIGLIASVSDVCVLCCVVW